MWIKSVWEWVLRLFGISKSITTDGQQGKNEEYTRKYKDIEGISFGEIFSKRIGTTATADSSLIIPTDNKRAELLNTVGSAAWAKKTKLSTLALGVGGIIIVPYVQNGKILFDIATQDRMLLNTKNGEKIINATILADTVVINDIQHMKLYHHLAYQ